MKLSSELLFPFLGLPFLLAATAVRLYDGTDLWRLVLVSVSLVFSTRFTLPIALQGVFRLKLTVDLLMYAASFGAVLLSRYEEAALLLFLFASGSAGEKLALERAKNAVRSLADFVPNIAIVRGPDGVERGKKLSEIEIGEDVVVRPFCGVPVDGKVISGDSAVDQSAITGEASPVSKDKGALVFAGTYNGSGSLLIKVERSAEDTKLARIVRLIEEAQNKKGEVQEITAKIERFYVPLVLLFTIVLVFQPLFLSSIDWTVAFYRAMSFLVAASPCALAIGCPAAVLSGIARAARAGVLIKGGVHLEGLARVRAVAFDKTGTLTRGKPRVTDVINCGEYSSDEVLSAAAGLSAKSSHPLAQSIVNEARVRGCAIRSVEQVQELPGSGMQGFVNGVKVATSSLASAKGRGNLLFEQQRRELEKRGETLVVVEREAKTIGVIALADRPREETRAMIRDLKLVGVKKTVMLTGDNLEAARTIADDVGIDQFYANLLPEDKVAHIRALSKEYDSLAMVGDGINDGPALATATVGIAMGGATNDVALETADVALMDDDLSKLPEAIEFSRFARQVIWENLVVALSVIALVAPAAAMGATPLGLAVLCHEGSTILVVLNALRLLVYKTKPKKGLD